MQPVAVTLALLVLMLAAPAGPRAQDTLKFRTTPQFLILDAKGRLLGERTGIIAPADFEGWVTETIR
jgi:hypothetical protein